MTALASHLETFLREYLPRGRRASMHTCDSYAHALHPFVSFTALELNHQPSSLEIERKRVVVAH